MFCALWDWWSANSSNGRSGNVDSLRVSLDQAHRQTYQHDEFSRSIGKRNQEKQNIAIVGERCGKTTLFGAIDLSSVTTRRLAHYDTWQVAREDARGLSLKTCFLKPRL
jgi:hypothetical protein